MTPFGVLRRHWRQKKQLTLHDKATFLGVSQAYLSALEHGKKGRPSFALVDQICVFLELIWDEAEALKDAAAHSHPKPTVNTTSLGPAAVHLANLLAQNIDRLEDSQCQLLSEQLEKQLQLGKSEKN